MTTNSTIPYWTPTSVDTERRLRDCLAVFPHRRQGAILWAPTEHSPTLSIAELITRFVTASYETSAVQLLDHSLFNDSHIGRLLARDDMWDDRITVLAMRRHRSIRAILADPHESPRDRLAALGCVHESFPVETLPSSLKC